MTVVIAARDEQATIGHVVAAAVGSGVGPVIVVADSCTDSTAQVAADNGATVIEVAAGDKGTAMAAGLAQCATDDVLFLDGDLTGLQAPHVQGLAWLAPLSGQVVGLLEDVPLRTIASHLPSISGERRLPAVTARRAGLTGSGFQAETRLNAQVARDRLPWRQIVLKGVSNSENLSHPVKFGGELATIAGGLIGFAPELIAYTRWPEGRPS